MLSGIVCVGYGSGGCGPGGEGGGQVLNPYYLLSTVHKLAQQPRMSYLQHTDGDVITIYGSLLSIIDRQLSYPT